jgi:hypothetical protein
MLSTGRTYCLGRERRRGTTPPCRYPRCCTHTGRLSIQVVSNIIHGTRYTVHGTWYTVHGSLMLSASRAREFNERGRQAGHCPPNRLPGRVQRQGGGRVMSRLQGRDLPGRRYSWSQFYLHTLTTFVFRCSQWIQRRASSLESGSNTCALLWR